MKAVPVLVAAAPGEVLGASTLKKRPHQGCPWGAAHPLPPHLPSPLQGSAPWHGAGLWASECSSQKGTGGACLLRRQRGGVRKAARVRPAAICPRALRKGSSGPASALISSKLLFALGPPAHLRGGLVPTPAPWPPWPRGAGEPWLLLLACAEGRSRRRGVTAAAPVPTREQ